MSYQPLQVRQHFPYDWPSQQCMSTPERDAEEGEGGTCADPKRIAQFDMCTASLGNLVGLEWRTPGFSQPNKVTTSKMKL